MNIHPKKISTFQKKILTWYDINKRILPWRDSFDPYKVMISEVMSQQTQVERVVPKYEAFLKEVSNIQKLALLPKQQLLRLRSGLGFNSRALRLQAAAVKICDVYDGIIPNQRELLLDLPGIGPYTSASICAFAYNLPEPVIDTNIRRVYIYELGYDSTISLQELEHIGKACIPEGKSNDWHNALMDYGSLVATSKKTGIKPLSKQSKFDGSDRQVRGRVLKQLVGGSKISSNLVAKKFPDKEVKSILRGMKLDGLIQIKGNQILI